ncbi:unnamed protein product [Dovyalis caffra]|uniref:Uncharacterized protein n=1 Tax=Dovyalis caffra TaxID=77055 RepID=A0AAV1RP41_9ROSI|nr:unnamed protein product [Dovyalis caffra]
MADIEPPSFSLGLDFETELDPRIPTHHRHTSTLNPAPNSRPNTSLDNQNDGPQVMDSEEGEEFGPHVMDSDPEPAPGPTRRLKRLRRGPASQKSKVRKVELEGVFRDYGDDDIEEFSSEEDFAVRDANPSTQFSSICSSSKVPLKGCGILTNQSSSLWKGKKKEQALDPSASSSLETGPSGLMFPKLTVSPLRRFQLIDSDSEEPSICEDASGKTQKTDSSSTKQKGCGALTSQSSSLCKGKKKEQALDASASSSLDTGRSGLMFPKLTISPLRRFQLIDSDSEEPSIIEDASGKTQKTDSSSKKQQPTASAHKIKMPLKKLPSEDLWKDFCPRKSLPVQTPVLDEMCNEYFQSLQENKNAAQKMQSDLRTSDSTPFLQDLNSTVDFEQCWNLDNPLPPAHHYFFHEDLRIQGLVCSRLPNFSPLGIVNNRGNQRHSESVIDYMSQFNGKTSEKQGTQRTNSKKGLTRGRNKSKKSIAKEVSHASEGWVDPKSSTTIPKDAGKRRVHASGQGGGHWYTSPEGRKVYVSKSGQELSGQIAYRHYKKDNGGFRKSKKKANTKGKGSQSRKKTNAARKRG